MSALAKPSAAHAPSETSPGVHDGQNLHASGEDGIASVAHGDCLALTTPELQTQVIPLCRLLVSCVLDHDRACLHDAEENRSRRRCGPIVSPSPACGALRGVMNETSRTIDSDVHVNVARFM